jgi:N-acetylmuramoyl-L-alanine amidase
MLSLRNTTLCLLLTHALACSAATILYVDEQGRLSGYTRTDITEPVAAIAALATPPSVADAGHKLTSAVPAGTTVLGFEVTEDAITVNFSPEILGSGLDDARLETLFHQVRGTLEPFHFPGSIGLQAAGKPLSRFLPPVPPLPTQPHAAAAPAPGATGALLGKKVSLSPGHGLYWNGSGWVTARPVYCSPLSQEDYHNLEVATYLDTYLAQDGATVKKYRCFDKNYGTYAPANHPWWHMAACYWTKEAGYPCSVYASSSGDCTLASGLSESNDSIRAGPVAANYDNTDLHIALHSNGASGDCTGSSCATGTETFYDSDIEHANYTAVSKTLATYVHNALIDTIRTKYTDASWANRGVKDAKGAYAETRIPQRPAILIELGFHDNCSRDAVYLRDNFFRSSCMWAVYKGVCQYFGTTPTWDYYSYEVVSHTLPSTLMVGATTNVQITLRNRGVLWNDTKQFRLGAVGDSDPFTTTTRYNVGAEIPPGQTKTFTITLKAPTTPGTYITDWQMVREGLTWFGPKVSQSIQVVDTQAPTVPANLSATSVTSRQINLTWSASSDNVGVSNYLVYRDSALIGTSATLSYQDAACAPTTTYSYQVSAMDAARNESVKSTAAQATTPAARPPVLLCSSSAGQLTLTWTIGILQQTTNFAARPILWTDLLQVTSPYQPPLTNQATFFRLRN